MPLPKQVEQQLKDVEEMERALTVKPEGEPEATDPAPASEQNATPTEQVVQPVATEVVTETAPPAEDWAQKYRSLKGHFDTEVPKLVAQNKELAARLSELQAQMEEVRKPKPEARADEPLVTEQDKTDYGADLIDAMRRTAREEVRALQRAGEQEISALQGKIRELESLLQNTSGDVTTLTFEQRLNRAVPDFEAINNDPQWVSWLNEVDEYTGHPRRAYAEAMYNKGDVLEVKRIVDLYKKVTGKDAKREETERRQKELERQVQPSRNPSGSAAAAPSVKLYTESEANRLFDKVRLLNSQGKYEEASSLEAELTNAYVSGRIRA